MPEIFHGYELPIKVYRDGDRWCALLGEDQQTGMATFDRSPVNALSALLIVLETQSSRAIDLTEDNDDIPF
jgi:hypothetical protein